MIRYKKASDIRVGVVGYGGAFNMGKEHLSRAAEAGMTPAAVTDLDPARLNQAQTDFPSIATFPTVHQMLKHADVDLIVIITPHSSHAKIALQCLKHGKHVVCEKPLALTTAECDAMIQMAQKNDVMLSTYHNRHWDGCIMQAVKKIAGGGIGDVVRIEAWMGEWGQPLDWWRSSKSISGGILYDWGVHLLEYMLQIVDSDISEVSGFAHSGLWARTSIWKDDTNEDEATAIVRFSNGAMLTLRISSIDTNPKRGWVEVTGTKGTYAFDWQKWEMITPKRNSIIRTTGKNPQPDYDKYYANIAGHLVNNETLIITPEWSRRPIHILDLAQRSVQAGKALKAKYR